jgi:hypothetical protein
MPSDEAINFMKAYALRGIRDWRHASSAIKTRAQRLLPDRLAQSDREAEATIYSIRKGMKKARFIPMPDPQPSRIDHSFFMPIRIDDNRTAFDLLILCPLARGTAVQATTEKCLGFRFEPADADDTTHAYGHVQMNRAMEGGELMVGCLPDWVPESYPAFPLRTSEPLEMFLSLATSIHGYRRRMTELLMNIIPAAGSRRTYELLLEKAMQ